MAAESFIVHIDSLAYGGRGVARKEDGKVVFVAATIPGETVRAKVTEEHKSYVLADAEEILSSSPHRITPPCALFSVCGGCDWQHMAYPQQVSLKQDILLSQIQAKCPGETPVVARNVHAPEPYGYRCHAIIRCSHKHGFAMGFYRKQSNTIVPHERCLILKERIQTILDRLSNILKKSPIHRLESIEIHAPQDEALMRAVCRGGPQRRDSDILGAVFEETGITGLSYLSSGAGKPERIFGSRTLNYHIRAQGSHLVLSTGLGSFIQVNPSVNELLVNHVVKLAKGSKRILDLYCGNGNFSLPLALDATHVMGIEKDAGLTKLGKINARVNGFDNVSFSSMDAEKAIASLPSGKELFDTVVLDPPREGAKAVVRALGRMKPGRVIYISCDPSTLSRDLAVLTQEGYTLKAVRLFDMFPQTYHMESVAYLER
jgi:23S rRNA (uracil1939-C5)-methyltransferase